MILEKIVENRMGENTYVVGDENTKKCIVVDPGAKPEDIINKVKQSFFILFAIKFIHKDRKKSLIRCGDDDNFWRIV